MEFLYTLPSNGKTKMMHMGHKDETLEWMIQNYRNFVPNEMVFGDINRVIAKLPEDKQDALWAIYKQIDKDMLEVTNLTRLEKKINENIKRIEEIIPYSMVDRHVRSEGTIWVPPDTDAPSELDVSIDAFNTPESKPTISRVVTGLTYTDHDIEQMNVLIIYMKLYLPILSHYYNITTSDIVEFFRCSKTMSLIEGTKFIGEDGYDRLSRYVSYFWVGSNKQIELNPGILMKGISQDNAPDWTLAKLVFSKLLPCGVSHRYQNMDDHLRPNFLKGLFHNVKTYSDILIKGEKRGTRQAEFYMNKDSLDKDISSDGENQSSVLEIVKVVPEIEEKAITINNFFLEDLTNFEGSIIELGGNIDEVENVQFLRGHHRTLHPFRTTILKWLCTRIYKERPKTSMGYMVSPKIIDYLSDKAYENVFKFVYWKLVQLGFSDIADIIDGYYDPLESDNRDLIFSTLDITADQVRLLDEYYPYGLTSNRVKGESRRNSNFVTIACQEMEDYVKGVRFRGQNRMERWVCDYNVRYRLADLIITLNQRNLL